MLLIVSRRMRAWEELVVSCTKTDVDVQKLIREDRGDAINMTAIATPKAVEMRENTRQDRR